MAGEPIYKQVNRIGMVLQKLKLYICGVLNIVMIGWFTGISDLFLSLPGHKVLVLAGTDRLDTSLTRGQMQGKFQLLLMYGCGHVIQEDNPEKTAEAILTFLERLVPLPGPERPSSSDTLAAKLLKARAMIPQM